ncbi:RNase P subunit p30 family protein [Natranaeroarchaeum aerophilus]|uniref:Ribonuclease P protein component 3 n=1 Tax=Natranaeroarchaeum aerophilus TaxID=2917711 RepID=A0AAE3K594_9EURY|nr:RNase P subunit p30 family protein [Natranaeroarchaeum aerophilus]MCL9813265.1 ribonuclease P [Natranaeroarchaeum aerophilus]
MYEAVQAWPDGDSTVARLAETASEYGYDGIVVRNAEDARRDRASFAEVREELGVDVVAASEITTDDPQRASGFVGNYRERDRLVIVGGGTNAINRFAVEQEHVDVLAHPMRGDGDFNHVLARAARDNGVRIEFDLSPVLRTTGGKRVQALRSLRKLRELVEQYDAPFVVSATPRSHLHLRAPRELAAVGETIGFDAGTIEAGLAEWDRLIERNREIQSESFIEPGVERGRYAEDT